MESRWRGQGPVSRRSFLVGASALGVVGAGIPRYGALAQTRQMTIGNWGGDWGGRIARIFEADFAKRHGVKMAYDYAAAPERKTKLLAERALPRGSMDVAWLTDEDAYDVQEHKLLVEPLDLSKIPNYRNILERLHSPFYVPWVVACYAILYNPEKVKEPPTSFADLWDPRFKGKVGINDMNFPQSIQVASLVAAGDPLADDAGFKKLVELKNTQQPKFYANHEHLASGFGSEEIWIATNYMARGNQWQKDGLPVAVAYPKEGMLVSSFGAGIPVRAQNKDLAYAYLNEILEPEVMRKMAAASFYAPAIVNADLPEDLRKRVEIPPEQKDIIRLTNFVEVGKRQPKWLDRWNREIKA